MSTHQKIAIFFFSFSLAFLPLAGAEIIRLYNDSIVEGKIIKEDALFVELEVKAGKVKIPRQNIKTIWRGTKEELLQHRGKAVHLIEGVKLYKSGKIKDAMDEFQTARTYTSDPIIHANLGSTYASLGEAQKAESEFLKALEQAPDNSTVHLNLGELYTSQKKYGQAITHYEKAITLGIQDTAFYRHLAWCYFATGQFEKALSYYQKMDRENDTVNQNNIAATYIELDRLDEAEVILKDLTSRQPPLKKAYLTLAQLDQKRGDVENAILHYKISISLNSKNKDAYVGLVRLYAEQNQDANARDLLEQAVSLFPDSIDMHYVAAEFFTKQKQWDQALAEHQKIMTLNPNDAANLNQMGLVYIQLNQLDKALETYQKIFVFHPEHAKAHANAGLVYALQDNAVKAMEEWNEALKLDPELKEAKDNKKLVEELMKGENPNAPQTQN